MRWIVLHPVSTVISLVASLAGIWALATASISGFAITAVFVLVAVVATRSGGRQYPFPRPIPDSAAPTGLHPKERRWIDCAYCGGQASIVTYDDGSQVVQETCGVCNGQGQLLTDLWIQPTCRRCGGDGRLVSRELVTVPIQGRRRVRIHRQLNSQFRPCDVCNGTGRSPFVDCAG